jgi:SAM-dependent methyltransferase
MATRAERAQSFGAIADDYDRLRPSASAEAVEWLVPPNCHTAVDVAAGTGKFTRVLAERVDTVYAVEPDDRMRAVLASRSPGVTALAGTGEEIPLPDASADALFVASAWHWLDPDRALPEIGRVLRDGGRLGVLWTSRDRDIHWVRDLDHAIDEPPRDEAWEKAHRSRRAEGLGEAAGYANAAVASFGFSLRMRLEEVVEMVATYSAVITAPTEERDALLAATRSRLNERFPGEAEIDLPMRTWCWRADRNPRAG